MTTKNTSDKVIVVGNIRLVYKNFRYRGMTINERYEGWMRNDFTTHKVSTYDSFEIDTIPLDN